MPLPSPHLLYAALSWFLSSLRQCLFSHLFPFLLPHLSSSSNQRLWTGPHLFSPYTYGFKYHLILMTPKFSIWPRLLLWIPHLYIQAYTWHLPLDVSQHLTLNTFKRNLLLFLPHIVSFPVIPRLRKCHQHPWSYPTQKPRNVSSMKAKSKFIWFNAEQPMTVTVPS